VKKLNSPLALALLLSLAVHAVLLTVRFVAPEQFNRVFKDTALEVILVNAQSQERPEHAQAIAQPIWLAAAMSPRAGPPAPCRTRP